MNDPNREIEAAEDRAREVRQLPPPNAPMQVAREMSAELFTHDSTLPILRHWRGGWWRWETTCWMELEPRAVSAIAYMYTEHAIYKQASASTSAFLPFRRNGQDRNAGDRGRDRGPERRSL